MPASAGSAVTIGPDTAAAPAGNTGCGGENCTFLNRGHPSLTIAAPSDGVLVRWRIRTSGATADWRLRTVQEPTAGLYVATGSTAFASVVPLAERTFPARLRIKAGDRLGVDGPPSATAPLAYSTGGVNSSFRPPLLDGGAPVAPDGAGAGFVGMFNADLEADADADGFGDETQDMCPTDAGTQGPCGRCSGQRNTVLGTRGDDVLTGTPGRDVISGLGGRDRISGLAGNDLLCGGAGPDKLFGGPGRDKLIGGKGRDRLIGGKGRDRLRGGAGLDRERQ
jgi:hypothetical protein